MDDLVVGDIIHLSAGGMIPADVRILDATVHPPYKSLQSFLHQFNKI